MLAGLFASLVGALLFAVAPNVWWVFAGRALMGIGVGLAASSSTAAILEFTSPESCEECRLGHDGGAGNRLRCCSAARRRLDGIRAMADPPLLLGTCSFPHRPSHRDVVLAASYTRRCGRRLALGMPSVPKHVRRAFAVSSTAMVAAYAFGVLVLSLGGQVEHDLIGSPNAFLNSAVLSLFPIMMGAIGTSLGPFRRGRR